MKVLVLANEEQKKELLALPVDERMELEFMDAPSTLTSYEPFNACIDLLFENTNERIAWLADLPVPLVVINSVIDTLAETNPSFVRINGWNTFMRRPVVEASGMHPESRANALELFKYFGRSVEWIPDLAGFITPRIISSIINEAFFALEEQVSSVDEIDTAMKLGTNYPLGPFEWGKKIGLRNVYSLLQTLSGQEARYQPSLLLKQSALA